MWDKSVESHKLRAMEKLGLLGRVDFVQYGYAQAAGKVCLHPATGFGSIMLTCGRDR